MSGWIRIEGEDSKERLSLRSGVGWFDGWFRRLCCVGTTKRFAFTL